MRLSTPTRRPWLLVLVLVFGLICFWLALFHNPQPSTLRKHRNALEARASALLLEYAPLRDEYAFAKAARTDPAVRFDDVERRYLLVLNTLANVISQYNRAEHALAHLEDRRTRWYQIALPPPPITDLAQDTTGSGTTLRYTVPKRDTLFDLEQRDVARIWRAAHGGDTAARRH